MLKQPHPRPDQISLNNLPQWSRINNLDRARYPKPFRKDGPSDSPGLAPESSGLDVSELETGGSTPVVKIETGLSGAELEAGLQKKVQALESSLLFLKKQHRDVLEALHEEVDLLKRQNHDLQFRVVMFQSPTENILESNRDLSDGKMNLVEKLNFSDQPSVGASESELEAHDGSEVSGLTLPKGGKIADSRTTEQKGNGQKPERVEATLKLEELEELKSQLKVQKHQNSELREELINIQRSQNHFHVGVSEVPSSLTLIPHPPPKPRLPDQHLRTRAIHGSIPYGSTVESLHVDAYNSRMPTIAEYEVIVRRLTEENQKQALELKKMKTDLREVLYTHKWTPDSYLLAKSYLPTDDSYETVVALTESQRRSLKQTKKLQRLVSLPKDELFLPPLNQSLNYRLGEMRVARPLPRRRIVAEQPLSVNMTQEGAGT